MTRHDAPGGMSVMTANGSQGEGAEIGLQGGHGLLNLLRTGSLEGTRGLDSIHVFPISTLPFSGWRLLK